MKAERDQVQVRAGLRLQIECFVERRLWVFGFVQNDDG
jgi:hypothetical protein